jgi:hypothetical protein
MDAFLIKFYYERYYVGTYNTFMCESKIKYWGPLWVVEHISMSHILMCILRIKIIKGKLYILLLWLAHSIGCCELTWVTK